jgi:prefoldin beta subunit
MEMNEESQQSLQELQILEHNMNNVLMQKQAFQLELNETINALEETKKTQDSIYKMAGSIMIRADKEKVLKELEEKKKVLQLRNDSLDKQEKLLETKAKELQNNLRKEMEKNQVKKDN